MLKISYDKSDKEEIRDFKNELKHYKEWKKERDPKKDALRGALTGGLVSIPINAAAHGLAKAIHGEDYNFKKNFKSTAKWFVPLITATGAVAGTMGHPMYSHPVEYVSNKDYRTNRDKAYLRYLKNNFF